MSLKSGVFISYGRDDALDFATRLKADLEQGGAMVFIDLDGIEKGGLWEVRIEQGIRASTVLVAIMTPHSLREESVCRDEVVFALNESKRVIPLKKDPNSKLKPSLLLARRNWIDFSSDYDSGLAALIRYLDGDDSGLRPPALPFIAGVVPLDFGPEIARLTVDFTGREWVNFEIDRWLASDLHRAMVIVSEPGVGKSAIAAWLSLVRSDVIGIHFCTQENTRTRDPFEFVANLVGQLHARLPGYAELVEAKHPEIRRPTAADGFRELIVEVARDLPPPDRQLLIVVDSLDEALQQTGETVVDVLVQQVKDLPTWLRIVATTRPEESIRLRIRPLNVFELLAERPENRADLRRYLRRRLEKPGGGERLGIEKEVGVKQLEALSEGNFLYARLALDALQDGSLNAHELSRLSPGLATFYYESFRRRFPDLDGYRGSVAVLLRALVAIRGPVPFSVLERVSGEVAERVRQWLNQLRSYLRVYGQGEETTYSLYHKSLKDWLTDPEAAGDYWCRASTGHSQLADALREHWLTEEYGLHHFAMHLAEVGRVDELGELLLAFDWLRSKVAKGLVHELLLDFDEGQRVLREEDDKRQSLSLLDGAVRLATHVLAKDASQLPGQLLGRLGARTEGPLGEILMRARAYRDSPWLRPMNASLHPPGTGLLRNLQGHTEAVEAVAVTPDGKRAVSASWDRTLKVWDLESGAELRTLLGHADVVHAVAVAADGKRAISASWDRTLKVWDLGSGAELQTLVGHMGWVQAVAMSADGRRAVSASEDRTLKVWDLDSGAELFVLSGHTKAVKAVAVTADGKRAISASDDLTLKVWDLESGAELRTLMGHMKAVRAVAVTADGKRAVSASSDETLKIWDLESGTELRTMRGHTETVWAVALTADGKRVVSASWDRTLKVWDLQSGTELRTLLGHASRVVGVVVTSNGRRAVSASWDRTLKVWDLGSDIAPRTLPGHASRIAQVAASADGRRVLSASWDRTLKVWDLKSCSGLRTLQGHNSRVEAVAVTADGSRAISGSDWMLKVWDLESGGELRTLRGHTSFVRAVAVTVDGRRAISGCWDGALEVWDLESFSPLTILQGHTKAVEAVAVTADGSRVISASRDRTLKVWDLKSGAELRTLRGHTSFVRAVAATANGKRAVSASSDQTLKIWDLESGTELRTMRGHTETVWAVALTADGKRVVSASWDRTLKVWDLESGAIIATFYGDGAITACAVAADSLTIVAGEESGRIHFLHLEGVD